MSGFVALVQRDLRLAVRQGADAALVLLFFLLGVLLFPFGIGPDAAVLARIGTGILWVMALLAALLSLERMFVVDHDDGSLDQLMLLPLPLSAIALAKAFGHWLAMGLPLVILAPLLAVILGMEWRAIPALTAALLLGTPTLSLIGMVGAALTLGSRRGGTLLALLVLPLYIPVLIFGAGAVEAALGGDALLPRLAVLLALLLIAVVLCPWATAAALREAQA